MSNPIEVQTEGMKLTSVTVNAASPDVIGALMKQITEAVLKAIPEGTIEKIAKEIINAGSVLRTVKTGYGSNSEEKYVFSEEAKKRFVELIAKEINRQVDLYLKEAVVQSLVSDAIRDGVAAGIAYAPQMAADVVASRVCGGMNMSNRMEVPAAMIPVMDAVESLRKTQQALFNKGVISYNGVDA